MDCAITPAIAVVSLGTVFTIAQIVNGKSISVYFCPGPTTFDVPGTFTIRGVSKPETLTLTVSGKGTGTGAITGTMAFDRKDYGMNPTAQQQARNREAISTNQAGIAANQGPIAEAKQEIAANQQRIDTNKDNLDEVAQSTKWHNQRRSVSTRWVKSSPRTNIPCFSPPEITASRKRPSRHLQTSQSRDLLTTKAGVYQWQDSLLSAKVRTIVIVRAILGAKTLLRGPGLDQRPPPYRRPEAPAMQVWREIHRVSCRDNLLSNVSRGMISVFGSSL
jgi:hypothetical protein